MSYVHRHGKRIVIDTLNPATPIKKRNQSLHNGWRRERAIDGSNTPAAIGDPGSPRRLYRAGNLPQCREWVLRPSTKARGHRDVVTVVAMPRE
jgi:hypothetical protein